MAAITLGELAARFGCELAGDPGAVVDRVGTLAGADGRTVAFLANPRYRRELATTRAGVVALDPGSLASCPCPALVSRNPYALYARIAQLLYPRPAPVAGVHPTALVDALARLDPTAQVGAFVVVAAGATVGPRCVLGPHSILEEGVQLAEDVLLSARVTLCRGVKVGARTVIQPGAVLGGDGFGFAQDKDKGEWIKIPQVGSVAIGADVEIGANTTIDRGAIEDTVVGDDVKLDNLIQIGHNVRIGRHTAIAGCTGVSGSTVIGERCQIGGAVSIGGHLNIADDVVITGTSMISRSIMQRGVYSSGIPFEEARTWRRLVGHFKRIGELRQRLARLEGGADAADEQVEGDD
jgi:UDP-3-O-[3-hydroxymyristoyl] glucosamine N-acyltransferase